MKVTLPDGTVLDASTSEQQPATARTVAAMIGAKLAEAAIGARVCSGTDFSVKTSTLTEADRPLADIVDGDQCALSIITAPRQNKKGVSKFRDEQHQQDALYLLRHSTAHVMAEAIERLWPDTMLAYGPALETGFYYDLKLDTPISSDDFARIEDEMKKIVAEDRPFVRLNFSTDLGLARLEKEGNKYKIDNAQRAIENGANTLSWYLTGALPEGEDSEQVIESITPNQLPWDDLCQGPHVDRTGRIGAVKVMSVASSNWHGDVNSDRFQRVYGTAFFSQADLDLHMEALEQAKARDHRVVGRKLGLFEIDEMVGQGLVLWKPKGAIVRQELQDFILKHLNRQGYSQVFTPHIGKLDLYRTSGHFPYYVDSQYPPILERETVQKLADGCSCCSELADKLTFSDPEQAAQTADEIMNSGGGGGYMLKPMNCPHHIRIYASEKRSYRDLPVRLAEFGTVYRWEQSGELGGMTRVRGFTQDDAHLFVTPDQLADEVLGCIELVKIVFDTLGMTDYRVRVGLRDPDSTKFVGKEEDWDQAEAACRNAAKSLDVPFSEEAGEAAFYGPKIDFVVKDVIGREWQLGTVQVDYQLPQRFDLSYNGSDNQAHRPIMIHRAPFGSMERFIGCLIEHFNGAFPLWLSPEQVRVLPISDKFTGYAQKVVDALKDLPNGGLRVSLDGRNDRINSKIKDAQENKVSYMLVVGGKDEEADTVSVRERSAGDLGAIPLERFVELVQKERDERSLTPLVTK